MKYEFLDKEYASDELFTAKPRGKWVTLVEDFMASGKNIIEFTCFDEHELHVAMGGIKAAINRNNYPLMVGRLRVRTKFYVKRLGL